MKSGCFSVENESKKLYFMSSEIKVEKKKSIFVCMIFLHFLLGTILTDFVEF